MRKMILPKIFKPFYSDKIIRLGKANDGGYLVDSRDVLQTQHLLSFGIGGDSSFERHFTNASGCKATAFDANASEILQSNFNIELVKKNIGLYSSGSEISIKDLDIKEKTFLKCDIDGSEYDILDYLIDISDAFTGMVIEFHSISQYSYFNELTNFIAKTSLKLLHTHPNNYSYINTGDTFIPDVVELTFTSQRLKTGDICLPHTLDMPNNPTDEDFELVF